MAAILAFPKSAKPIQEGLLSPVPHDFLRAVHYIKMADMYDSLPEYIGYLITRCDSGLMTCHEVDEIAKLFGTRVDWSKQP